MNIRNTIAAISTLTLTLVAAHASADRVVQIFRWDESGVNGQVPFGEVAEDDERGTALLLAGEATRTDRPVLRIQAPDIRTAVFSIRGHVRHTNVDGDAMIILRASYPGNHKLEVRTEHESPLQSPMTGDSEWRPFQLTITGHEREFPERIEVRLLMPGEGRIVFGPIRLVEISERGLPARTSIARAPWWNEHTMREIFIIVGLSVSAILFFVVLLALIGRGRGAGLGLLQLVVFIGAGGLIGAVIALYFGQPWAVWFPLAICGFALFFIPLVFYAPVARRFDRIMSKRLGFKP